MVDRPDFADPARLAADRAIDSVVAYGQKRALLVWQRIILPDGSSIQIDNLPATDMAGYAGLQDKVSPFILRYLQSLVLLSPLVPLETRSDPYFPLRPILDN